MRRGGTSYIGTAVHVAIGRNPRLLTQARRLYLDHAAITPVLPEAREAIARALEGMGNPSSPHADGRRARALLEDARRTIAEVLGWRHDVIFTSGGSEAIEIVARRSKLARRIVGPTEHEAVIAAMGPDADQLPVHTDGLIDLAALEAALGAAPALVAIQQVNNETGVVQPLDRIAEVVHASGSLLLADCAQGAGKLALPEADFIALPARNSAGRPGRRTAGPGPGDAPAERRAGEGLSPRHRESAGRRWDGGGARRAQLRQGDTGAGRCGAGSSRRSSPPAGW